MLKINTQKEHQTLGLIRKISLTLTFWFTIGLLSVSQGATITYHHFDALGSPVASTDEAGQVVWREAYQPFGTRLRKENNENTLWYTGKPTEEFYRVSYFGARWYNPEMGRFMAMDPVGVQDGNIHSFNRYTYGNNNPYRFFDPDGREPKEMDPRVKKHVIEKHGQTTYRALRRINKSKGNQVDPGLKNAKGYVKEKGPLVGNRTKHIDNRHIDRTKYPDKSKFKKPNQVDKINTRTVKKPDRIINQKNNRVRYEKDFERDIGTKGERTNVTVINSKTNKRVTQFPKK